MKLDIDTLFVLAEHHDQVNVCPARGGYAISLGTESSLLVILDLDVDQLLTLREAIDTTLAVRGRPFVHTAPGDAS